MNDKDISQNTVNVVEGNGVTRIIKTLGNVSEVIALEPDEEQYVFEALMKKRYQPMDAG